MEEEHWRRVREIFEAALERPAFERAAFLDSVCAGDSRLREEIEQLLRDDQAAEAEDFLDDPGSRVRALRDVVKRTDDISTDTQSGRVARSDLAPIGPYQPVEKIGQGGMGVVYLAEQRAGGKSARPLRVDSSRGCCDG